MSLTIGDFVLRIQDVNNNRISPEKVESIDSDTIGLCNRVGANSNINRNTVLKLDRTYEDIIWDQLIQLEVRILLYNELLDFRESFGYHNSVGIVKKIKDNLVVSLEKPWKETSCNHQILSPINDSRLVQIEKQLEDLETEHDFITEAIHSIS